MTELIVAAALRIQLPRVTPEIETAPMVFSKPQPARHHHLIFEVARLIGRPVSPDEQGFLTSAGRYVDRDDAYLIAASAGQVDFEPRHLFSEDLW